MIVYRSAYRKCSPLDCISDISAILNRLDVSSYNNHDIITELLIEFGELESGIVDALCPEEDASGPISNHLRSIALLVGRIFYLSWEDRQSEIRSQMAALRNSLASLAQYSLPRTVNLKVPEGYAYYGLYPETYLEAAKRFVRNMGVAPVMSIGIRSIGTSLSSVVAATLYEMGCKVRTVTVRPRGHPFDRLLRLAPDMEEDLKSAAGSFYLIVDEGPGLSGSSLCCTAARLSELGIDDDNVVLFPSWEPDGSAFFSESARERWGKHTKYIVSFEDVWLSSGRLARSLPFPDLTDLSAGKWRGLFYSEVSQYPAVHPHHERRKYICSRELVKLEPNLLSGSSPLKGRKGQRLTEAVLLKFAGLGRYGKLICERAQQLSDSGFAPPVLGFSNGFTIMELVQGRPMSRHDVGSGLLDRIAEYLSYLTTSFPVEDTTAIEEIIDMAQINTGEGLGEIWGTRVSHMLSQFMKGYEPATANAIDGRMFPHEWILSSKGIMKADGTDHSTDHFFPGCQNIAWDLSAACIEFGLGPRDKGYLLEQYRRISGDTEIEGRLPFYSIAYLAFRLGYVVMAADTLGATPDGQKFRTMADGYRSLLREAISSLH